VEQNKDEAYADVMDLGEADCIISLFAGFGVFSCDRDLKRLTEPIESLNKWGSQSCKRAVQTNIRSSKNEMAN